MGILENKKIIFYDDECGFCNKFILFVIKHDVNDVFRFTPLNKLSLYSERIDLTEIDSIILSDKERFFIYSDAIIQILNENNTTKPWAFILKIFPKSIRDIGYKITAKIRKRIIKNNYSCTIPSKKVRDKFI